MSEQGADWSPEFKPASDGGGYVVGSYIVKQVGLEQFGYRAYRFVWPETLKVKTLQQAWELVFEKWRLLLWMARNKMPVTMGYTSCALCRWTDIYQASCGIKGQVPLCESCPIYVLAAPQEQCRKTPWVDVLGVANEVNGALFEPCDRDTIRYYAAKLAEYTRRELEFLQKVYTLTSEDHKEVEKLA